MFIQLLKYHHLSGEKFQYSMLAKFVLAERNYVFLHAHAASTLLMFQYMHSVVYFKEPQLFEVVRNKNVKKHQRQLGKQFLENML